MDGNDLIKKMREFEKAERSDSNANYVDATAFRAYVIGVYDALSLTNSICTSSPIKRQVGAIVEKYINNKPERWGEPAYYLVEDALKKVFPCKK